MKIGAVIKKHRLARGWKQEYFARLINRHRANVYKMELKSNMELQSIVNIANVFGIKASDMIKETEQTENNNDMR